MTVVGLRRSHGPLPSHSQVRGECLELLFGCSTRVTVKFKREPRCAVLCRAVLTRHRESGVLQEAGFRKVGLAPCFRLPAFFRA